MSHLSKVQSSFLAHYRQLDQVEQDLWTHLTETAKLSSIFASKIGLADHGEFIGLLHDIGKATEEFDRYIRENIGLADPDEDKPDDESISASGTKIDHSSAGAQLAYDILPKNSPAHHMLAEATALIIASHHSGLIDCLTPDGHHCLGDRLAKDIEKTRKTKAWGSLHPSIKQRILQLAEADLTKAFQSAITASFNKKDHAREHQFFVSLTIRFLFSALIDADRLNTADFENPNNELIRNYGLYPEWNDLIHILENHLSNFSQDSKVNVLRHKVSNQCKEAAKGKQGIYRLTVPTGGGKTLASLRFAMHHALRHKMDRIIFVVPYTSIIDQNAEAIRDIFYEFETASDKRPIVLEHHSNLVPEKDTIHNRLLSENWDAPIVLTTMVQFLEALFGSGTTSSRRMHQLANAVVIFDEIQTLPIRTVHLFNLALRFLTKSCNTSALLCTATQPLLDQVNPEERRLTIHAENEIVPNTKEMFRILRRVRVKDFTKVGGWSNEEIANLINEEAASHKTVLAVVNTKQVAADIYRELLDKQIKNVYHLSTNMCAAHRLDVLKKVQECLKEQKQVICISTQLIEAGVDIDFNVVIRSLAGLDSLTQAAGRCNRNGRLKHLGRVILVNPNAEKIDKLRDIKIGQSMAERIITEFHKNPDAFDRDLLGPKSLKKYFKYYLSNRSNEMSYPVVGLPQHVTLYELLSSNDKAVAAFQRKNSGKSPEFVLRQSFMSAYKSFEVIQNAGQGILVPYKDGKKIIKNLCGDISTGKTFELLRKGQLYSINIHQHELRRYFKGVIHETREGSGVLYLDESHYSHTAGFLSNTSEIMESLIV